MENLIAASKANGLDWKDDPKNRRPRPDSRRGTGATSEVFGNSFAQKVLPRKSILERDHDPTFGSDDELDSIASSDRGRSTSPVKTVVKHGQEDPVARAAAASNKLKGMRFKKNKPTDIPSTLPPVQPKENKEPSAPKPPPGPIRKPAIARSTSNANAGPSTLHKVLPKSYSQSSTKSRTSATAPTRKPSTRSASSSKRHGSVVSLDSGDDDIPKPPPKPKAKAVPKPKPKRLPEDGPPVSSQASSSSSRPRQNLDSEATPVPKKKTRRQVAAFPLDLHSPLSSSPKVKDAGFPDMSPLSSPAVARRKKRQSFPGLSPLSSPARSQEQRKKGKATLITRPGRQYVLSDDDAEDEDEVEFEEFNVRRVAAPFPMNTQALASIESSTGSKRLSDSSLDGGEPSTKRRKSYINPDISLNSDDEDNLFLTPAAAPDMLCPFCDSKLPSSPTPFLRRLIAELIESSTPDSRPTNPLGRKAPMNTYLSMCQRHDFERKLLPQAEKKGWPKEIEWSAIEGRIRRMEFELQELIDDADSPLQVEVTNANVEDEDIYSANGPRARCIFWRELMKEVKAKGASKAAGVRNQFATFDKSQPGYYGEQGSSIIHQTLYDLFPPSTIDPSTIDPLTPAEFIQKILIPEVALRLIMEDRNLVGISGIVEGVKTLRESSAYGVSMFPDDGAGDGTSGVADKMARKRAQRRRRQLDEEEEGARTSQGMSSERAMSETSDSHPAPVIKARPKPKPASKARQRSVDIDLSSEASYSGNESPTASETYETGRRQPMPAPFPMELVHEHSPTASEEPDVDLTNDISDDEINATPRPRASSRKPAPRNASRIKMGHEQKSQWLLSSP